MIGRRDFLRLSTFSAGALALRPFARPALPAFPQADRLGRITVGKMDVYTRPENLGANALSGFEGETEVHFARISSGSLWEAWGNKVDAWAAPVGEFPIWRKAVSLP